MSRGCHYYTYLVFFICIISFNSVYPQSFTGILKGKVTDALTNLPLPEVNIMVKDTHFGTITDSSGEFLIKKLPPGRYQLIASAIGYNSISYNQIVFNSSSPAIINFKLNQAVILFPEVKINSRVSKIDPFENISSNTFSQKEIKNIPGSFGDVIRTISSLPGIARTDPFRNDLIVRGGGPSENLFLLDDIPVPNINHYGNQGSTGGPVSFVDIDFVNSVFFSSGGFSAQYGDKLSSVTNINFRDGNTERLHEKALVSLSGFGLSAEGPISKNSNFIISARRSYLDAAFKMSGFTFTPEYYDFFSKINYKLENNSSISFMFIAAYDNVKFFKRSLNLLNDNPRAIGSQQSNYIGGISYKAINHSSLLKVSLSRNFIHYETIPNHFFDNKSFEAENIIKGDYFLQLSKADEISVGVTGKVIELNSQINLKDFTTTFSNKLFLDSTQINRNFYKADFYTQYTHLFNNGASLSLGIRYDYFNPIKDDYTISPRFSFTIPVLDNVKLNFSTGIYYQTPSYIWLAGNSINYHLKSLRSDHYIMGIDYNFNENSKINIEAFYKYYRDYPTSVLRPYLVLSNTGAGFSGVDDNFEGFGLEPLVSKGRGRSKGISLQLENHYSAYFVYFLFNITYCNTYYRGLDGISRTGSYDQEWNVNFLTGYKFTELWKVNLKFNYSTGRPYTPYNEYGIQEISRYNSSRFKPQHSLDLRISKDWIFSSWKISSYLDLKNLYNKKNISFIRWDSKNKKIADDPILGIIPSIGIIAEL